MKKIAGVFFVYFFVLAGVVHISVSAQTTSDIPARTRVWSCLTATNKQIDGKRLVELTGTCQSDNKQCYIVTCATSPLGTQCTTGSSKFDNELGFAKNSVNFSTDIEPLLQTTDNNIHLSVTVIPDLTAYTFYAIGNQTTQSDMHTSNMCTPFHPEPWGRVFDSQSLEPLGNVQITLLDSSKKIIAKKDYKNPVTSSTNGVYNFAPIAGDYVLNPHAPLHYSFMNQSFIHPNAKKAYGPIYKPNQLVMLQTDNHIDIALNPGVNTPYHAEPRSISYSTFQTGTTMYVAGLQTHPLTKIIFKQGDSEIMTADADRYGYYEAPIPDNLINIELPIDVYFSKIDLTVDKQTATPQKVFDFDPYAPYLVGRTIDKKGNVIPYGVISIILPSKSIYAQTTSDEKGIFSFLPMSIPPISYTIRIENPNTHQGLDFSVSEFARLNKDYLTMKNINLITATNDGKHLIVEPSPTGALSDPHIKTNLPGDDSASQSDESGISNLVSSLVVIFIVFVCIAGFYVYSSQKKKKSTPVVAFEEEGGEVPPTLS